MIVERKMTASTIKPGERYFGWELGRRALAAANVLQRSVVQQSIPIVNEEDGVVITVLDLVHSLAKEHSAIQSAVVVLLTVIIYEFYPQ